MHHNRVRIEHSILIHFTLPNPHFLISKYATKYVIADAIIAEITIHIISAEGCPSGFARPHKPTLMKNDRTQPRNNATNTAASISSILKYVFDTGFISVIFLRQIPVPITLFGFSRNCIKKKRGYRSSSLIPRTRPSHCPPSGDKQCRSPRCRHNIRI